MKLDERTLGVGARTVALIHGITGDHGTWFEVAPALAERGYTVTMVDLRGHGTSPRGDSYAMEEMADDLVETLGDRHWDLVMGHSLGGRLLALASGRLDADRTVFLDPGWTISGVETTGFMPQDEHGTPLSTDQFQALNPRWSREQVEAGMRSFALFDQQGMTPGGAVTISDYEPPVPPEHPSLVLLADGTQLVPPAQQERLRAGGYEVRTVAGAGHNFQFEDLEGMLAQLEGWI